MAHTLDLNKLPQIFEELRENQHKLNSWECDRLDEWEPAYERNPNQAIFTDPESKVMGCIEKMYIKV